MRRLRIVGIVVLTLTILFVNTCKSNTINIQPNYQYNKENTQINILITCIPTQPIKAYEFKIRFNASLLTAINVNEGDFFQDYMTFYNAGIINNTQGTIINIYDLIVGQGNITTTGTLVNITFTAKNQKGVSNIEIYDEGLCNETQYIPVETNNGALQIYGQYYPWDVNEDNHIDFIDISAVVSQYTVKCYPPGSNTSDIREDGVVNYLDVSILVYHYGE